MKLPFIQEEVIVTSTMADMMESQVNEKLTETEYLNHFHILQNPKNKKLFCKLRNNRISGATLILKQDENSNYSYQYSACSIKENFIKVRGRYYAYKRANEHGFVPLSKTVTDKLLSTLNKEEDGTIKLEYSNRIIVNYIISNVINTPLPLTDKNSFKDKSGTRIKFTDLTPNLFETLEELAKIPLGPLGYAFKVIYRRPKELDNTTIASLVVDKKAVLDKDKEAIKKFNSTTDEYFLYGLSRCGLKDNFNSKVGRYIALERLADKLIWVV